MPNAEITAPKQRGRPFAPGQSGNPNGRPKGARGKATMIAEALLDGEAEKLTRKAIEMAMAGSEPCLRLCMERILPPKRAGDDGMMMGIEASGDAESMGIRVVFVKPKRIED